MRSKSKLDCKVKRSVLFVGKWPIYFPYPVDIYNYPIVKWRHNFRGYGFSISFQNGLIDLEKFKKFDIILADLKSLHKHNINTKSLIKLSNLVVLDHGDSAELYFPEYLSTCILYLKRQVYKKNDLYSSQNFPTHRVFTKSEKNKRKKINVDDLKKLHLSWNYYFMSYFNSKILRLADTYHLISRRRPPENKNIKNKISARFSINHNIERVRKHRKAYLKLIKSEFAEIDREFISQKAYYQELRSSKFCVSPFGFGEICVRDFEALFFNNIVIKPSLKSIESFPNLKNFDDVYFTNSIKTLSNVKQKNLHKKNYLKLFDLINKDAFISHMVSNFNKGLKIN